jgi:hypothetical protein
MSLGDCGLKQLDYKIDDRRTTWHNTGYHG